MSRTADDYINDAYGKLDRVLEGGESLDGYRFTLSYEAYRAIGNSKEFMCAHGLWFNALDPNRRFLGVPFDLDPDADGVVLKKPLDT